MELGFLKKILDFTAATGQSSTFFYNGRALVIADLDAYMHAVCDTMSTEHLTSERETDTINAEIARVVETQKGDSPSIDNGFDRATLDVTPVAGM